MHSSTIPDCLKNSRCGMQFLCLHNSQFCQNRESRENQGFYLFSFKIQLIIGKRYTLSQYSYIMQPHLNCNSLICGPLQSFAKIRSRMLHKLHCTDYIFCLLIWTTPTNNFCRNREDHLELPSQKYTGLFLLIVKCLYKIL